MRRSFESTFRKAQDGATQPPPPLCRSGELKGFVFPYLGQRDQALPVIPATCRGADQVVDYRPTSRR